APNLARAVLDDEGKAEGEQQAIERIAPIDAADQQAFNEPADDRGQKRRDNERAPKTEIRRQRVGKIAADHQKSAMREVNDAGKVENKRQPDRHQRVERADDEAIRDVEQNELRHGRDPKRKRS